MHQGSANQMTDYSGRPSAYESSYPSLIPTSAETDGCFFLAVALIMQDPDSFEFLFSERNKSNNAIYWKWKRSSILSVWKMNVPSKIGPMELGL